jgi:uncharacterized membrane protein YgcG
MTKRAALLSAMLLAGVVVAVVGATAALRFIGSGAFGPGGKPLTQAEIQQSLAQQPSAAAPRRSSAAPVTPHPTSPGARIPAPPTPVPGSFTGSGGTVNAVCLSGQVRLTSWIPAQGYLTDGYSRGPGASAWVMFKSSGSELTITATCGRGSPRFTTATDVRGGGGGDRHGGGGGGSGRGGGGSSGGGGS